MFYLVKKNFEFYKIYLKWTKINNVIEFFIIILTTRTCTNNIHKREFLNRVNKYLWLLESKEHF